MMLLKLGLVLLIGISSSEVANPGCNLYWHFWFRSSLVCSLTASASPCFCCWRAGSPHGFLWWLQHLQPRLQRGKHRSGNAHAPLPLPKGFKSKTLDWRQACCLLTETKCDRGFAKTICCLLSPVARHCQHPVLLQGDICSPLAKLWSLNGIHVFLMRDLENLTVPGLGFSIKHSHSLQLSGFPRRDVGGWFPCRVSSSSYKSFLPHFPFPAPFTLSHCACPCASLRVDCARLYLDHRHTLYFFMSDRDVLSRHRTLILPSQGSEVCQHERAAFKDVHICLISYTVQLLSLEAPPVSRLVSLPQLLPQF